MWIKVEVKNKFDYTISYGFNVTGGTYRDLLEMIAGRILPYHTIRGIPDTKDMFLMARKSIVPRHLSALDVARLALVFELHIYGRIAVVDDLCEVRVNCEDIGFIIENVKAKLGTPEFRELLVAELKKRKKTLIDYRIRGDIVIAETDKIRQRSLTAVAYTIFGDKEYKYVEYEGDESYDTILARIIKAFGVTDLECPTLKAGHHGIPEQDKHDAHTLAGHSPLFLCDYGEVVIVPVTTKVTLVCKFDTGEVTRTDLGVVQVPNDEYDFCKPISSKLKQQGLIVKMIYVPETRNGDRIVEACVCQAT